MEALNSSPTYTLAAIPSGVEGTRATLEHMCRIANEYKTHGLIRELALTIVKDVPSKFYNAEIMEIHACVKDAIKYRKDIFGVETLQTPIQTIRIGAGDCDDHSILTATLLMAIGHPCRFVAVGLLPGTFCHVFTETKSGDRWLSVETTENYPVGKVHPGIASKMIRHCQAPEKRRK